MNTNSPTGPINCIGGCCLFTMVFGIIGGLVTIIIFDIIALKDISPSEVHDLCPESGLWYYVLLTLAIPFISGVGSNFRSSNEDQHKSSIFKFNLTSGAMLVWGCIELWSVDCVDELKHELLYSMALCHVLIGIIGTGCGLCMIMGVCMCFATTRH